MKRVVVFAALSAGVVLGQATSPTGFGRQLYPGTGGPTAAPRGGVGAYGGAGFGRMIYPGTGAPALLRPGAAFGVAPTVGHPNHGRGAIVAYPVFYGGGYYDSFLTPPPANPATEYDLNYPSQRAPVVIINQSFRPEALTPDEVEPAPAARVERRRAPAAARRDENDEPVREQEATIYLVAMKDDTIFATLGYWVEGDTLVYITREGSRNTASLSLVDRELSQRLNDERHVEFKLPKR